MKKTMIVIALAAMAASGPAMAQRMGGPKAGTTRDQAIAASVSAFGRFDQNGDGSVDNAEATAALQARAAKNGKEFRPRAVERMIKQNDGNGDGVVTLDEFKIAAGTAFDAADTNKNGTIDADEGSAGGGAGGVGGGE